ncbi:Mss4-like protein [Suillus subalutaceus]|uniref:Mss4-like protein n=1 Tax=Suillus subalutaceus TaxID=48586 RepID=UPI001B86A4CA|nr:Mss4-like protein [Suillus subalutaceus]KAG1868236.1 Mss4-like protein [Suillus subalutaceus]
MTDHAYVPLLQGSCFCQAVSYAVSAHPILSAYCHCTSCQRLTSCPFIHTMHFDASAFTWTHPEPHESQLDFYDNILKPYKRRYRCKTCGVGVASHNYNTNRVSIWGATLNRNEDGNIVGWDIAKPTAHQFYGTRMLDVNDDLTKWEGYESNSDNLN